MSTQDPQFAVGRMRLVPFLLFSGLLRNVAHKTSAPGVKAVTRKYTNQLSCSGRGKSDTRSTDSSEHDSDQVGNNSLDGSHKRHFKPAGPPGTDRDNGFGGAYSEMRQERNDGRHKDGRIAGQEEKGTMESLPRGLLKELRKWRRSRVCGGPLR